MYFYKTSSFVINETKMLLVLMKNELNTLLISRIFQNVNKYLNSLILFPRFF